MSEQLPTIIQKCEILEVAYTAAREEGIAHGRAVKMCLKMHAVFRGSSAYIPALDPDVKLRRNEKLLREWRRGEQVKFLARRYGITERRVRQIINGNDVP